MDLKELPTQLVRGSVDAARLPLHVAASVLKRAEDRWPPTLLFDTVAAEVKGQAAKVLRDPSLKAEAVSLKTQVEKRREAAKLEAIAQHKKRTADAALKARTSKNEQSRRQVEEHAKDAKTKAREAYATSKQKADAEARAALAVVRQREEEEQRQREAEATIAQLQAAGAEARALEAEQKAIANEIDIRETEKALKQSKQ